MARPRVFVSSTYYDLKYVRSSLEVFISSLGFESVLFEKGDIAFHPDAALDESCYREAQNADIFVLVIGGRYGSAASEQEEGTSFDDYESITKKEFQTAQEADVPTYILVESSVHSEYRTYLRNKDKSIDYAHVDSPNVFKLIETILEKKRNNAVFGFSRAEEIETWLREQWAGLFRELLRQRSQQRQLSTLNSQVSELQSINSTLKSYLEAVLNKVSPDASADIIQKEEQKLEEDKRIRDFESSKFFLYLLRHVGDERIAKRLLTEPKNKEELFELIDEIVEKGVSKQNVEGPLRYADIAQEDYNQARRNLKLADIDFNGSKSGRRVKRVRSADVD